MHLQDSLNHHVTTIDILRLFRERGHSQYGGEAVSQEEHALQAAFFAEQSNAAPSLIAAALIHDIGHLLHALPDDAPEQGIDDRHEVLAGRWLAKRFGPDVVEPVEMHVAAKRYLCATEPGYMQRLSPPSILSLELQGGPMSADEAEAFRSHPFCAAAVALRRWDDAAKIPQLVTAAAGAFCRLSSINRCKSARLYKTAQQTNGGARYEGWYHWRRNRGIGASLVGRGARASRHCLRTFGTGGRCFDPKLRHGLADRAARRRSAFVGASEPRPLAPTHPPPRTFGPNPVARSTWPIARTNGRCCRSFMRLLRSLVTNARC